VDRKKQFDRPGVRSRARLAGALTALFLACAGQSAQACAVPVFRYALEHWPAVPCRTTVFYAGVLTPEQRELLNTMAQEKMGNVEPCSFSLPPNRPGGLNPEQIKLWKDLPPHPPPVLAFSCWGGRMYDPQAVLGLPFDRAIVEKLTQLPFHREVARRLLAGDSAVWVLLKSPNVDQDRMVRALLDSALREAEKTIKLPGERDPNDTVYDSKLSASVPLRLRFSVLEVPGTGLEATLFRSVLRTISANASITTAPVIIPVFGRGLALDAISGETIDADQVRAACEFLCGDCSCTVKANRPGVSLFLPIDWEKFITQGAPAPEALPPLTVPGAEPPVVAVAPAPLPAPMVATPVALAPKTATVATVRSPVAVTNRVPAAAGKQTAPPRTELSRTLWVLLGAGLLGVAASTFVVLRRQGRN